MAFRFPQSARPHLLRTGGLGGEISAVRRGIDALIQYIEQPTQRTVTTNTDTVLYTDFGGALFYSFAGAVTIDLPDLSPRALSGRVQVLTMQATDAATELTVHPGASVTIDGAGDDLVPTAGKSRVSLISYDGKTWFSGTP